MSNKGKGKASTAEKEATKLAAPVAKPAEAKAEGSDVMRNIYIDKVVVNICVGESGDRYFRLATPGWNSGTHWVALAASPVPLVC